MQNMTLKKRLTQQLAIISISFLLLILVVAFFVNIGLRSSIIPLVYIPKAQETASEISFYFQTAQEKAIVLRNFAEEEVAKNNKIDAILLNRFLNSIRTENDIFQSVGIYIKSVDWMTDTAGLSNFIVDNAFSMQLNEAYWGPSTLSRINDFSLAEKNIAYNNVLNSGEKQLVLPYFSPDFEDRKVFTSYLIPIKRKLEVIGFVKVDYNFSDLKLERILNNNDFFDMQIISSNGIIAYNSRNYFEGRSIKEIEKEYEKHLLEIQSSETYTSVVGNRIKISLPIKISKDSENWQLELNWQNSGFIQLLKSRLVFASVLISSSILLITLIFAFVLRKHLLPFGNIVKVARRLEEGDIDIPEEKLPEYEFSIIQNSFNKIVQNLRDLAQVTRQIGQGDYTVKYELKSDKDAVGKAVLDMGVKLKNFYDEEQRLKMDAQNRAWISEGLAKFSVKLKNVDLEISDIFTHFLPELVDYVEAVQATIFKLQKNGQNEDNWELNLISAYAYHQNKYLEKNLKLGEGLVGMCAKEKKSFLIKDVPDNYIFIKSGFGATNPKNIFIVPLIFNELVYGVLEIATLSELARYKTEFIEQLSENIAGTLAGMENSEMTNSLLSQTKKQAQELQAREEELRQNLEELQATQEKYKNNQAEMKSYIQAIEKIDLVVEFDKRGRIIDFNKKFAEFMNIENKAIRDMNLNDFIDRKSEKYNLLFQSINSGKIFQLSSYLQINKVNKYFTVSFAPVVNANNNLIKIIAIGKDTTEYQGNT